MAHQTREEERLTAVEVTVNDHSQILGPGGENFTKLQEQVTTMEETVTTVQKSQSIPKWALIVGAILGIIAGWKWANHDFNKTTVNNVVVKYLATQWWVAPLFGLCIACIFVSLVGMFSSGSSKTKTKTSTKSKASTAFSKIKSKWQQCVQGQPPQPQPSTPPAIDPADKPAAVPAHTTQADAQTQQLTAQ